MIFWLLAAGLVALVSGLLGYSTAAPNRTRGQRRAYACRSIATNWARSNGTGTRGLLSETEAKAARLEIERRILGLDRASPPGAAPSGAAAGRRPTMAGFVILLVPLASLSIYLVLGSPGMESQPFAERPPSPRKTAARWRRPSPSSRTRLHRTRRTIAPG